MTKTFPIFLVAMGLGITGCGGDSPKKEAASAPLEEYFQSFKGMPEQSQGMKWFGPGAEECVHFEPAGLRINLPLNHPKERPTGLATGLVVRGDFEITMSYEILSEPEPANAGKIGTRLSLLIGWEKVGQTCVKISRTMQPNRGSSYMLVWGPSQSDKNWTPSGKMFATRAKSGRLRLARTGGKVSYLVADEDSKNEFTLLHQIAFGGEDLDNVRVVGTTGDPKGALDFRVSDLRIRAASLPNVPADVLAKQGRPQVPVPMLVSETPESKGWLAAGLLIGLVVTLSLALCTWLLVRRRRHAAAAAAPAVPAADPDDA